MTLDDVTKFGQAWHPIITWTLVILGWWIVSKQQDKREGRKELRQRIDAIIVHCNAVVDQASAFYMRPGSDLECEALRAALIRDLGRVTSRVSELAGGDKTSGVLVAATAFRKAVTLDEFDDKGRAAKSYSDQRLQEIRESAQELIASMDAAFAKQYSALLVLRG